ncbi:MAG: hypothetical protein HQM08_22430 [Candidatus Riflebacteria bacterium]|nr:hypothetical protein [Candidatus Riflebacteria bacterium]
MDRRIVFLILAIAIAFPLLKPIGLISKPGENVKKLFNFMEKLPAGSKIFLSFDYDPSSMPEVHPAAVAILVHAFKKGLHPICGANWPFGGDMADMALKSALEKTPEREKLLEGRDYANLGFQPGVLSKIKVMSKDLLAPFQNDRHGRPTKSMEIFQTPPNKQLSLRDFSLILSFSAGAAGIGSFISTSGEHGVPISGACTSISIPDFITFVQTGQLTGLIGGMPGAAEYEVLLNYTGMAGKAMDSQSMGHLAILFLILAGNLFDFIKKKSNV